MRRGDGETISLARIAVRRLFDTRPKTKTAVGQTLDINAARQKETPAKPRAARQGSSEQPTTCSADPLFKTRGR
jgi:hypothetical protein